MMQATGDESPMTSPAPENASMIRQLFKSRFFSEYGSVFVLLLLCGYYSFATLDQQYPITPSAGRKLARQIVEQIGESPEILIFVRETELDRQFSSAIDQELQTRGGTVVAIVTGSPRDLRGALTQIGENGTHLDAVVTHESGSKGLLQADKLGELIAPYPSLQKVRVFKPESYLWPSFLTRENLLNVINQNADVAIIAIGMTLVIITAGIDLSVGSLLAVSGVATAICMESFGGPNAGPVLLGFCSLIGIFACIAGGVFNGLMITFFNVPAFVVTLAMMMIARGIALIIAVRYQSALLGGTTEGTPEAIKIHAAAFRWLGNGELAGVPNPIWLMVALYVLAHLLMTRTAFGRYVYAVGGNPEAARLSGVPVKGVLIAVYALCAAMAGLGGIVDASRFEGGRPNAGELYELQVIAAVVVGGTSLAGGEGRIMGTLIGAMIIAVIQNGLNMAGVKSYEQKVVFGLLILFAVILDQLKKRHWK